MTTRQQPMPTTTALNTLHRRVVQRGEIHLFGRRYQATELAMHHGKTVTVVQHGAAPGLIQVCDDLAGLICTLRT